MTTHLGQIELDHAFFTDHPDRRYRIRLPEEGEWEREYRSLGPHEVDRRRVIVKRVEEWRARYFGVRYMPIPFLLFADETVEDRDDVLAPIFDGIMKEGAQRC